MAGLHCHPSLETDSAKNEISTARKSGMWLEVAVLDEKMERW